MRKKIRRIVVCVLLSIVLVLIPRNVVQAEAHEDADQETQAVTQEDMQDEWLEKFDFSEIDGILGEIFPREKLNFRETIEGLISGKTELSVELVIQLIKDQFAYEVSSTKKGMIHILLLVIVAAIFSNFSSVFKSTQVSEISFSMLYMVLITICLNNFRILIEAAELNIERLTQFMELLGPIYFLAVAFATGSSTSVTFYQLVLLVIYLIEILIQNFLIPLTQIYLIVRILSELSPEIPLTKFAELLESIVSWTLKTVLASVVGLNLIQGLLAPAIDSVKRSLLTKTGEAIPIIGDAIGGVAEVMLGTAVLIKNGIGVAGMIICLVICLVPMIQMTITTFMYQLIAALIQPVSDKRLVNCVSSMADGTRMLLRIVFTSGVLFLITIAVVANTTGG